LEATSSVVRFSFWSPTLASTLFRELSSAHAPDVSARRRVSPGGRAVRDTLQDDAPGRAPDPTDPAPLRFQTGPDRAPLALHSGSDARDFPAAAVAARAHCSFYVQAKSVPLLNWLPRRGRGGAEW